MSESDLLEIIRSLREKVNWELEEERRKFLNEIEPFISDRQGRAPNLRGIFRPEEIESLLWDSADVAEADHDQRKIGASFIKFVAESGYKDEPRMDVNGKPLLGRATPIHRAAKCKHKDQAVRDLFKIYHRFDVNYVDESGLTHFYVACATWGCEEVVREFLEAGQDPNVVWREKGDYSPLHLAVEQENYQLVRMLLRAGADPNCTNEAGSTPLHIIYRNGYYAYDLARMLLEQRYKPVPADPQDNRGDTPLHHALSACGFFDPRAITVLLKNGADPNLANREGSTPLHAHCQSSDNDELTRMFFAACKDENKLLLVDAKDNAGKTPLHHAVAHETPRFVRVLLELGADPNSTDAEGFTPLHAICRSEYDDNDGLAKYFFKICVDSLSKAVLIDAKDKKGRTPLQWAVASNKPNDVDSLLNRGADLSSFVYPTESHFDEFFERRRPVEKTRFAVRALTIVERLEGKGYELYRSDALTIMRLFAKYELFERSANLEITWEEEFESVIREYLIHPGLSLYDPMELRSREAVAAAAKRLTLADYRALARSFESLYQGPDEAACELRLCEMLSRQFFRAWALDPFMELTHCRLPTLCCEMIMENLTNQDLYTICLAATGQS